MNKHSKNTVTIEVNNFGPISEAKVELRPLTVLVGPSNAGKSYFAILVNALQRSFALRDQNLSEYASKLAINRNANPALPDIIKKTAVSLLNQLEKKDQVNLELDHDFHEIAKNEFNQEISFGLNQEILRCFGINNINFLYQKGQPNSAKIKVKTSAMRSDTHESHSLELSAKPEYDFSFPSSIPFPQDKEKIRILKNAAEYYLQISVIPQPRKKHSINNEVDFINAVISVFIPFLVGPLDSQVFYLPADRTGIIHAHSVIVSSLIALSPEAGLRQTTRQSTMTGVLADFLDKLIKLSLHKGKKGQKGDLGRGIEKAVLQGSVNIKFSKEINYPIFSYQPNGWKEDIPMANASSMVSEVAPIVLFLRYTINPGMLLIIEEPESHLHPSMQVELTRQLAKIVKLGIRIVVTTHSEWLIEALANIVHRSNIPKDKKGSISSEKIELNEGQVGVWLFQNIKEKNGTVVNEIKLDKYTSWQYPTDYDDIASALHNEWAEITNIVENS